MPRWNRIAARENFVVVYPEGTSFPLRWNAASLFLAGAVDDVQFFRDMIADVAEIVALDPARIYVNGMSNGGTMTNRIACELADSVAAVGTVAAVPLEAPGGCRPSRPVPVIAFHGTADPVVSYEGATYDASSIGGFLNLSTGPMEYPAVETWITGWAERNGCNTTPETIPASGDASGIRYTGCQDGAEVILYTIAGGGHTWPGSTPIPFLGKTSTDIDASECMWEFFKAHPLNR